jgi:hypothetical protein
MNELSAALRQFADRVDAGELLPGANQCAIVLSNDTEVQSVYMGPLEPAARAGINLLAAGISRFNVDEMAAAGGAPSMGEAMAAKGSIFGAVK